MSTIVVVRKGTSACIACDTLANIGSLKQKAHYCSSPGKIFGFRDAFIGTVGYAVHNSVLQSYFARHAEHIALGTPADIFETWRRMHKVLREEYHMNPRRESDDAYETTRMTALIANPKGIFGITPARDVESYPRFWAVGSGAPRSEPCSLSMTAITASRRLRVPVLRPAPSSTKAANFPS